MQPRTKENSYKAFIQVCGYVSDKKIPKQCPVCGAPREKFKTIADGGA